MSVLPSGTTKHPVAGSSASDKLKKSSNSSSSISLVSGLVNTSGLTIQSSTSPSVHKSKANQQPSISITPLPRSTPSSSSTPSSRGKSPSVEADSHQAALSPCMDNPNRNFNTGSFDWRQDLMSAADSVTDAMSSLVLEYNGGEIKICLNH